MVHVPVANLLIIVNRAQKRNDNPSCIFPTPRWITFIALVGLTYRFAFSSDARREAAKWQSHGVSHMIWNWIDVVFIQFIRVCPRTNECSRQYQAFAMHSSCGFPGRSEFDTSGDRKESYLFRIEGILKPWLG